MAVIATAGKKIRPMTEMEMSLSWAEVIWRWANVILIGALILGVLATYGIVVSGNIKERYLKRDIADASTRAATANNQAADANERASQAAARAAEAELALEKYRAGRSLTEQQMKELERVLRSAPKGAVIIKPNLLSPEPTRYANGLSEVFNRAGFSDVGDKPLSIISTTLPGIFLVIRDGKHQPPHLNAIAEAFRAAEIPFSVHAESYVPDLNTVVILVGERP